MGWEGWEGLVWCAQGTPSHGKNFRETLAILSCVGRVKSVPPTCLGSH